MENEERNRKSGKKRRMKKEGGKKELHHQRWKRKWEGKKSRLDPTVWAWEGRKTSVYCRVFCKKHEEVLWAGKESFLFIHSICLQYMLKGEEDQGSLSLPHHRVWCLPLPLHLPWTLWNSHRWWVLGPETKTRFLGSLVFSYPAKTPLKHAQFVRQLGFLFWNRGSSFCQVFCNAWEDYFGLLLFVGYWPDACVTILHQSVMDDCGLPMTQLPLVVGTGFATICARGQWHCLTRLGYNGLPLSLILLLESSLCPWNVALAHYSCWAAIMLCCKLYFMWYFRAVWWWLVFVEIVLMEC